MTMNNLMSNDKRSQRKLFHNLLPLIITLLFLPSVYTSFFPGKIVVISTLCFSAIAVLIFFYRKGFNYDDFSNKRIFYAFLFFNVITLARGFFNIKDSNDIHVLFSNDVFVYLLYPMFIFLADLDFMHRIWKSFCTIGVIGCLICFLYPPTDGMMSFGHNLSFLHLFFLCTPFIHRKYLYIFLAVALFAILQNLDRRSILINYTVLVGILVIYRLLWTRIMRKIAFLVSAFLPLILLILGLSGIFNVFQFGESINLNIQTTAERKYNVDSRTSIYQDVFGELALQNKLVFGLGARGKTATSLRFDENHDYWKIYKYGRTQTESGMLNYFQYGGFVGYIAYSLFFLSCIFLALFRSNNDFIKLIGLFLCFKYFYSFIEDQITVNLATFCLYLLFGLCMNRKFRRLSNKEIRIYLNRFFKRDWHIIEW